MAGPVTKSYVVYRSKNSCLLVDKTGPLNKLQKQRLTSLKMIHVSSRGIPMPDPYPLIR